MRNSTFRLTLAPIAVAMIALSASATLSADEPAAKDAPQQQAEQTAADLDKQAELDGVTLRFITTPLRHLVSNADSFLGVEVIPVDDVLRSHLGLTEGQGLTVANVSEGGAAAQAGIQANDVLVAIGEQDITGAEGLHQSLQASLNKPISLAYIRGGQRRTVEATPRAGPALVLEGSLIARAEEPKYWLGVGLANADDTLRSQLGVPAGEGLVVTGVESDSPASKAGVMVNDLLLKLDGKPLKKIEELAAQLQEIADRSVALELLRRGKPASLTVTPQKPEFHVEVLRAEPLSDVHVQWVDLDLTVPERVEGRLAYDVRELLLIADGKAAPPGPAAQVSALVEQVKQLQASLEALQAALQNQPATAKGEQQKSPEKSP